MSGDRLWRWSVCKDDWLAMVFFKAPLISMFFLPVNHWYQWFSNGFLPWNIGLNEIWIQLRAHDPLKIVAGWHHNIYVKHCKMHMYTFTEEQSAHKLIKKLADIMKIIQVSPVSKVYPILSWIFIDLYRQLYRARCQFEIFYDVDSKIVSYPNTGFIGFVIETFQGFQTHLCQWMVGKQPLVSMVFGLANHW